MQIDNFESVIIYYETCNIMLIKQHFVGKFTLILILLVI